MTAHGRSGHCQCQKTGRPTRPVLRGCPARLRRPKWTHIRRLHFQVARHDLNRSQPGRANRKPVTLGDRVLTNPGTRPRQKNVVPDDIFRQCQCTGVGKIVLHSQSDAVDLQLSVPYAHFVHKSTLELLGPAPCDNCRHRAHCAATSEACLSFSEYQKGSKEFVWRLMPTQPRADLARRLKLV